MATNNGNEWSFNERTRVTLLGEEHWQCVQRQFHLSPRELQVAKLVCQGFSNDEIAEDLKMKLGTVKTHVRNIYRRIRVGSKLEMLLKFIDNAAKLSTNQLSISPAVPITSLERPSENTGSFDVSTK